MKLSDIKGSRSLDVVADAMELIEELNGDKRFESFMSEIKKAKGDTTAYRKIICTKLPGVIRDHKQGVIRLMASANGVSEKEYAQNGEVLKDIIELLTSDLDSLGFLAQPSQAQK